MTDDAELAALRRDMRRRHREARAAVRAYNRGSWIRFASIFVPVPLVVVSLRLYLEAWHYYVLGGGFIVVAMVMYALDERAAGRREAALAAARESRARWLEARAKATR